MRVIYDRDKEQKIKHFEFAAFLNDKLQECGGNSNEKKHNSVAHPWLGEQINPKPSFPPEIFQ